MPETAAPRIVLDLSLDQANLVLEALGQLPFARVYELIATVQEQAHKQLTHDRKEEGTP
jgi:hypothetical protein